MSRQRKIQFKKNGGHDFNDIATRWTSHFSIPFEDFLNEKLSTLAGSNSTSVNGFRTVSSLANTACLRTVLVADLIFAFASSFSLDGCDNVDTCKDK